MVVVVVDVVEAAKFRCCWKPLLMMTGSVRLWMSMTMMV